MNIWLVSGGHGGAMDQAKATTKGSDAAKKLYARYFETQASCGWVRDIKSYQVQARVYGAYLRQFLPSDRGAQVLDIGCGSGGLVYWLQQLGYLHVEGVDVSASQVAEAHRAGITSVREEDLHVALAREEHAFDLITAIDVFEHIPKAELIPMLRGVRRALRPGGRLLVQVPNASSPIFGSIRYGDFTHEVAFTAQSIRQVFKMAELDPLEVVPVTPPVRGLPSAARWLAWQAARLLLVGYYAIETGALRGHVLTRNLIAVARRPR
jgi:2-polyprenyl-3-methyl-5-hydroxy-6-metoxy-1,4-benzoquinol methylase